MLEIGIDDSFMYFDVQFDLEKNFMEMYDVGLNVMYIVDCQVLVKMVDVLG